MPDRDARRDAVFVSDVHLSSAHPATARAFARFLDDEVAGRARRLFVLGDLFEAWAGDDDDDALARDVARRFRALSDDGIALSFIAGNRDFLIGAGFGRDTGMALLPDPYAITLGGVDLVLSHGDALCTDDVDYQAFRSMVREPAWQAGFLAQPLAVRRAVAHDARAKSEGAKRGKSMAIMDANDDAIAALLAAHPGATLIHGHTHRPMRHEHVVDGAVRERWVLTDWDAEAVPPRGGGLALSDGRLAVLPSPLGEGGGGGPPA